MDSIEWMCSSLLFTKFFVKNIRGSSVSFKKMFHFCCYKLYLNSAYLVDLHPKNNLNNLLHQRIKLHLLFSAHLLGYALQFSSSPLAEDFHPNKIVQWAASSCLL